MNLVDAKLPHGPCDPARLFKAPGGTFVWIHTMTLMFAPVLTQTGQEVKVTAFPSRTLGSPETRGAALPLILFNLFSDGALE